MGVFFWDTLYILNHFYVFQDSRIVGMIFRDSISVVEHSTTTLATKTGRTSSGTIQFLTRVVMWRVRDVVMECSVEPVLPNISSFMDASILSRLSRVGLDFVTILDCDHFYNVSIFIL